MLKSFLFKKGKSVKELKSIGHDIRRLLSLSIYLGFPSDLGLTQVLLLSEYYRAKKLEYRPKQIMYFPQMYFLIKEVDKLGSVVYDYIIIGTENRDN